MDPGEPHRHQHQVRGGGGDVPPQVISSSIVDDYKDVPRAIKRNHEQAVQTLLAAGADVDTPNREGRNISLERTLVARH